MPLHYLNPIASAIVFAFATLFIKRSLHDGAGATRAVFVTNATFLVALLPLWWIFPATLPVSLLWVPVAAGFSTFAGSVFQTIALKIGDASVATPLLGGKVIFVALFSTIILGNVLPSSWWLAAILSGLGVFLIGKQSGTRHESQRLGLTMLLSLLSVICFALMDILIAGWGHALGFQHFVVIQQGVTFALTACLIPFFSAPLRAMPRKCWSWLLIGSLLMVAQFYLLNWTISRFGDPTAINIFYSSRGIWTVILVWTVGPMLGNRERHQGWKVFIWRTLGALLLLGAVFLVIFTDAIPLW